MTISTALGWQHGSNRTIFALQGKSRFTNVPRHFGRNIFRLQNTIHRIRTSNIAISCQCRLNTNFQLCIVRHLTSKYRLWLIIEIDKVIDHLMTTFSCNHIRLIKVRLIEIRPGHKISHLVRSNRLQGFIKPIQALISRLGHSTLTDQHTSLRYCSQFMMLLCKCLNYIHRRCKALHPVVCLCRIPMINIKANDINIGITRITGFIICSICKWTTW